MKIRTILGWGVVAVVAGMAVLLLVWLRLDIPVASRDLDRQWERAERNGYPLVAFALKPHPPVRSSENAAPLLLKAAGLLTEEARSGLVKPEPASNAALRQKLIALASPSLNLVERAALKPKYSVDRDYDLGSDLQFPEFKSYKALAYGLAYRAEDKAAAGDLESAIRDLQTGRKMAALVSTEPMVLAEIVAVAMDHIITLAAEQIAQRVAGDPSALAALRKSIEEEQPLTIDLRVGLRGEIYGCLVLARNLQRYRTTSAGATADPEMPIVREGPPPSWFGRASLDRGMTAWNDLLESQEWRRGDPVAISELGKSIEDKYSQAGQGKLSYKLFPIQFPVFVNAGKAILQPAADRATLISLLKALEFRATHGAFPRTLAEAGADAPDPYLKGSNLHYSVSGGSAKVWSVGANGKDDGGDYRERRDVVAIFPAR